MVEQRLPYVNGDDGQWGDILNQFLEKEHYNTGSNNAANGGHQNITIQPGTSSSGGAPLTFSSGSLLTLPQAGSVEFQGDKLYFTQTTGPTRKTVAVYNDSSGATGDIYYRDAGGYFVRLGIGAAGQVLTVASGLPAWSAATAGGTRSVQTISSATTAGAASGTDYVYYVSGSTTITLPTAVGNTNLYTIKNVGSAAISIATTSSQTISGTASPLILKYTNSSVDLISDNSNWWIG